jgi:hypothetical protein
LDSFIWIRTCEIFWQPLLIATAVLLVCWTRGRFLGKWRPLAVPLAGLLTGMCSPVNFAAVHLQSTPVGIIAIVASFLLFAMGTAIALTKHRWHQTGE